MAVGTWFFAVKNKRIRRKITNRVGQRSKDKPRPAISRLRVYAVATAIAVLTLLVFGRAVTFPFINFDDPAYVFERPQISQGFSWAGVGWTFTHVHSGNWHPLTSLSHMMDCQLFGLNAGAHHLINVLLHTANAVLLFFLLLTLTNAVWRSGFVAAVFAIHPLRVESVAWIAERKDVLSGLFFMLTLITYVRYTRAPSFARYLLVASLFAAGLMAKPMLVSVPAVLLLLDYWPLNRFGRVAIARLVLEKLPLLVVAVAASIATLLAQTEAISTVEQLPLTVRVANALTSYVIYIGKLFWPSKLALVYPYPSHIGLWQVVIAVLLLFIVSLLVFAGRARAPYLLTGWTWYVVMLLPVIGLIHVGRQAYADRYTYLPQIGLGIALTWGAAQLYRRWRNRRAGLLIAAGIALVALAALTSRQLSY